MHGFDTALIITYVLICALYLSMYAFICYISGYIELNILLNQHSLHSKPKHRDSNTEKRII